MTPESTYVDRAELNRRVQVLRSEGSPGAVAEAARLEREAESSRLAELRDADNLTDAELAELEGLEKAEAELGQGDDEPDATDSARELAKQHNIDLADVRGSGEGGRIIKSDVEKVVE